ncbi:MAG TPA: FTR1 family protein [Anaerolineales bacterium]
MLASILLALREGLEAALIVGIVLGALRKMDRGDLAPAVWRGTISAIFVSLAAAIGLTALGLSLEGPAEPIFEGAAMLLAAAILTWMIFWMNRQSRYMKQGLETGVRRAALSTGKGALFGLAFLAVVREGIELALFLTAAAFASGARGTILGGLVGLAAAAFIGWSLFASTIRLDLKRFFQVTGVLLLLFAAGLVGNGVHEFNEVGWIPALVEHVWDLNPILSESSGAGVALKALVGYNGNPSLTEVMAYLAYVVGVLLALRRTDRKAAAAAAQVPA